MKFQTISLLAGTKVCNASCPFCVSKMTGMREIGQKAESIDEFKLNKALQLAKIGGVTTAIITGKGEPTLYPEHITTYIEHISMNGGIPFIELQTNGTILAKDEYRQQETKRLLGKWAAYGLTTVLLSIVHYDPDKNKAIYLPKADSYIDLPAVIKKIRSIGLMVRLTCVGLKGHIDTPEELDNLMAFAKQCGVEQVSWRPVIKSEVTEDPQVNEAVDKMAIEHDNLAELEEYIADNATPLYQLVHGAQVFDYNGQNLCVSNCLTLEPEEETIRQLIFFPNGQLYTDWQYKGSRLL